jgi:2-polyprenyl-3-methyl-5-hydroxy-6-metoxy-1,4-benzoquinol methylase
MNWLRRIYLWFECPHRLVALREVLAQPAPVILDVGCGNHSPSLTKRHAPHCVYHGLDRQDWNTDERDRQCGDAFFDLELDQPDALSAVEDGKYDAVICSHVLEHLSDPCALLERLAPKLKRGGLLYIEAPSPKSERLPRATKGWFGIRGCLNFYDDPTHRTLVHLSAVTAMLAGQGFQVGAVRNRFLWRRVLLLPAYVLAGLLLRGYIPASVVWDVSGFAQCLTARKS